VKGILEAYLKKCRSVFDGHRLKLSRVIPFPASADAPKPVKEHLDGAIADAEKSEEFDAFVTALENGPLASSLASLRRKEETQRERIQKEAQESGRPIKFKAIDNWCRDTARQAARSFFKNTGTYHKLWTGLPLDESDLTSLLATYGEGVDSEYLRLFVFDGFVLYHQRKRLDRVELPVGELKKYEEKELEGLLKLPQTAYHGAVNPEIPRKASRWHILTVREKTRYRGLTGIWLNGVLISSVDWPEVGETLRREDDIDLIGPLFLCVGEDANLAVEIRVRSNIFESVPGYERARNGYLAWNSYDEEGEPAPRTYVKDIGEGGKKLVQTYELWRRVNELTGKGYLRFATETYVRSVMNLHNFSDNAMEVLVAFVTAIESLLTPNTTQELGYKIALRGAAILSRKPTHRLRLVELLYECYGIRSQIVHLGHAKDYDLLALRNFISLRLTEIARQIFIRYICIISLADEGNLPVWIQSNLNAIKSKKDWPKVITTVLDALVLDPNLTIFLEEKMAQWGLHEEWVQRTDLRFEFGE